MMHGSLPARLRLLRAQRALTQVDAASRIGISRDTLSDLERGIRRPTVPTLAKIAEGYDVDVEELLEEPEVLLGKAEAPTEGLVDLSDIDELRHEAKALKAEWRRLAAYDRVVELSEEEYLETMRHLEEIEEALGRVKEQLDDLNPPLAWVSYQLDGPHQVEFYREPTPEEEEELRAKLGDYEVVESVFELAAG